MSATPTPHEIEMAAYRAKVAADTRTEIEKCIAVLGNGADAYGCWVITDKLGKVPDQVIPTCRRGNGWEPPCPNITERLTKSPSAYTDKSGVTHHPFRFTHSFWSLNEYRPQTAEQLAVARQKREEKERLKLREEMALFPDFNPAQ